MCIEHFLKDLFSNSLHCCLGFFHRFFFSFSSFKIICLSGCFYLTHQIHASEPILCWTVCQLILRFTREGLFSRYIGITMISLSPQMLEELRQADHTIPLLTRRHLSHPPSLLSLLSFFPLLQYVKIYSF
jgi:hypothetical protein